MNRRSLILGSVGLGAVSIVAPHAPAKGISGTPVTLGLMKTLIDNLLDLGADPETLLVTYVDGRPPNADGQVDGPGLLRTVTYVDSTAVVGAGSRVHWQRHADPSSTVVLAIG